MKLLLLTVILIIVGCTLPNFGINLMREENYTVKVTWLGHAGFMFESKDTRIYVNPYSSPVGALKGDGIIVTYSASDICDLPSIRLLAKDDSVILVPPECNARLAMSDSTSLVINSYYNINSAVIQTIDAYYPNGTINKGEGAGLIITMDGVKIYYAGITGIIPEMNKVKNVDLVILP
ncbi:MAG TPA: MBL fold metallo-hydrolase, partial [Candidatus Nanoarchaeia archaeon]|nr:MBL fold metallo-hydrolase [Candidatus Nanoarchaeia archaeon]